MCVHSIGSKFTQLRVRPGSEYYASPRRKRNTEIEIESIMRLAFVTLASRACIIPYSRKIWWFGGMPSTTKLKSAKFFSACMFVWRYRTIPPNLNPPIVLKTLFGAKPPNLMTANISGYTVF